MYLLEAFSDFICDFKNNKIDSRDFFKRFIFCLWGFSSKDYVNYCLDKRSIFETLYNFIPYYRRKRIRGNDKAASSKILQNKYETLKVLHINLIPTTTPQYLILDGDMYTLNKDMEIECKTFIIDPGKYVIKPLNMRWGKGIAFFTINNRQKVVNCLEIANLINEYRVLMIEKKLCNHMIMSKLNRFSLNTLRIVTIRSKSGNIEVVFACVRFSSTENKIDNWSSGGFAANIDLKTGMAQAAVKKDQMMLINSLNKSTEGFIIPFFDDAKRIAIRAHEVFIDMKSIGWDIAITPNGAIIIEGNDDWDVILPQKLLQKGMRESLCRK